MTDTENQERIAVKRERDAFARGRCMSQHEMHEDESAPCTACWQRSVELYPMPKVERPRVVRDPDIEFSQVWRVVDGAVQYAASKGCRFSPMKSGDAEQDRIYAGSCLWPTPARIALWADLLKNPTELVDADD